MIASAGAGPQAGARMRPMTTDLARLTVPP